MAFTIEYTYEARNHLDGFRKYDQKIIVEAIDAQLEHEPDVPTRNRKKLEEGTLAPWELRIGDFRVFYDVSRDTNLVVILAIGRKVRNRLFIAGEEK